MASTIQLTVKVIKAPIPARGEKQSGMGLSGTFVDAALSQLKYFTPRLPQESKMSFSQRTLRPADTSVCLVGMLARFFGVQILYIL